MKKLTSFLITQMGTERGGAQSLNNVFKKTGKLSKIKIRETGGFRLSDSVYCLLLINDKEERELLKKLYQRSV